MQPRPIDLPYRQRDTERGRGFDQRQGQGSFYRIKLNCLFEMHLEEEMDAAAKEGEGNTTDKRNGEMRCGLNI